MVEIIDIPPVTVDMIACVTVPEFIIRVSVIVVFIVPVVISLFLIALCKTTHCNREQQYN